MKLIMQTDEENKTTSFNIKEDFLKEVKEGVFTEKILFNLTFKNVKENKLDEITNWLNKITKYANQIIEPTKNTNNSDRIQGPNKIIDSKNNKLSITSKLTPESINDINNSKHNEIKEIIEKINSPKKISCLFYIIKKQIKELNIIVNNDFQIKRLYNTSREIEDTIEFLKKLNKDSNLIQDQNDREIFKKIHNYINSLSEKDLLIKVLGNIVEKASSILDVMKKNVEHMTLGQLIQKEDLNLNKLKRIMNSSTEHFFNKEKTKKPEEFIHNNESTSKKRMIDEDNCYEHNNKKAKKSDICHIKDKKISHKIKQPIEYSEKKSTKEVNNKTNELNSSEKSTKEVNNKTNELHSSEKSTKEVNNETNELNSSGFQFTCYIYPRFKGIKSVKIPNQ